jgi:hypothetical protein
MSVRKMKVLPKVPSKLILIALEDIEAVEKQPKFKFRMNTDWVTPLGDNRCAVCAAGAVLVNRIDPSLPGELDKDGWFTPEFLDDSTNVQQLLAINNLREGDICSAFADLDLTKPDTLPDYYVGNLERSSFDGEERDFMGDRLSDLSHENRKAWKLHMQDLAGILQSEGF